MAYLFAVVRVFDARKAHLAHDTLGIDGEAYLRDSPIKSAQTI